MRALVIVDLQVALPIPARLLSEIKIHAENYTCCVFTRFVNPEGSLFRRKLKMQECSPGSLDTRLLLVPRDEDLVVEKEGDGVRRRGP